MNKINYLGIMLSDHDKLDHENQIKEKKITLNSHDYKETK